MTITIRKQDFEWLHDDKDGTLLAVRNGRKYGSIIAWSDDKTGEPGFTGNIVSPDGSEIEFMPSEGFATPLALAKEELLSEIINLHFPQAGGEVASEHQSSAPSDAEITPTGRDAMKVIRSVMDLAGIEPPERAMILGALMAEVEEPAR